MPDARLLASGDGWKVCDVTCTAGPGDSAFEEQYSQISIAVVVSGTFQYRTTTGRELMTPGSILLGDVEHTAFQGVAYQIFDRATAFKMEFLPGNLGPIPVLWRASPVYCVPSKQHPMRRTRSFRWPGIRASVPCISCAALRDSQGPHHGSIFCECACERQPSD